MAQAKRVSRTEILSRSLLAIFGSYALASAAALAIARFGPGVPRTAISLGEMIGFLLFGAAAVAAFSMRSAAKAWIIIGGATIVVGAAGLFVGAAA